MATRRASASGLARDPACYTPKSVTNTGSKTKRERGESRSGGSSESLKKYLKEISRLDRVKPEEERELGRKIQEGDARR